MGKRGCNSVDFSGAAMGNWTHFLCSGEHGSLRLLSLEFFCILMFEFSFPPHYSNRGSFVQFADNHSHAIGISRASSVLPVGI